MLHFLRIEQFLHVAAAELTFGEGLHCITGESGAGKTVLLKALRLLLGDKPPPHAVRHGASEAIIEAAFDSTTQPAIHALLEKAGISHDPEEWLLIKRIVPASGRSRVYVNSQATNTPLLEKLGVYLVEIVGQHAGKQLLSSEYQRKLLDTFGQHDRQLDAYLAAYSTLQKEQAALAALEKESPDSLETLQWQREELEKHRIHQLDIEAELTRHEKYTYAEEVADTLSQVAVTLREHVGNQILALSRQLEKCCEKDPSIAPITTHLQSALLEIEEAASRSEQHLDSLHFDQEELQRLEELSQFLTLFKRRHGVSYEKIQDTYRDIVASIERLADREASMTAQRQRIDDAECVLTNTAAALSKARAAAADALAKKTQETIRLLKIEDAQFGIEVEQGDCKKYGRDTVSFYLLRQGRKASIRDVASGGELSRILLAMKAHIATRQTTPTLIFDEIDSNIGGETANVVAQLLQHAAEGQQLLTITHFPQVASQADHHYVVEKIVSDGIAQGSLRCLFEHERKGELLRMVGGASSPLATPSQ